MAAARRQQRSAVGVVVGAGAGQVAHRGPRVGVRRRRLVTTGAGPLVRAPVREFRDRSQRWRRKARQILMTSSSKFGVDGDARADRSVAM